MLVTLLLVIASLFLSSGLRNTPLLQDKTPRSNTLIDIQLIQEWAPLLWLAPGEMFKPLSVESFLKDVTFVNNSKNIERSYIKTKVPIRTLLANETSFIYGKDPNEKSIPVYADITKCKKNGTMIVKYWFYYPFNRGKEVCMSPLGTFPIPLVMGKCLGRKKLYGDHLSDWEHITMIFDGEKYPKYVFIAYHNSGSYYKYNPNKKRFEYHSKQNGVLETTAFIKHLRTFKDTNHLMLFSALGSHGIWPSPKVHKYFRIPGLFDSTGFGEMWKTWENVEIVDEQPWANYHGMWGPPKSSCDLITGRIVNFLCRYINGPHGIRSFRRREDFYCPS